MSPFCEGMILGAVVSYIGMIVGCLIANVARRG